MYGDIYNLALMSQVHWHRCRNQCTYKLIGAVKLVPRYWEGGWDVHLMAAEESALKGDHTALLGLGQP